jgi:membrane-associated phospholipid phosphatase
MKFPQLLVICTLASAASYPTYGNSEKTWDDISNVGVYSLMGTALLLPTVRDDWEGLRQAVYSVGAGAAITLTGKTLIDSERPDESDDDSFPSGHATNAFSSATTLHRRYGWKIGVPAYAVATLTGVARERAREHHWYDVVAGAVIGTATGWFFTDPFNDQVQLIPWADSNGGGVTLSMRW